MERPAPIASLTQAVPDAALEAVPSVDLQPTVYVPRDRAAEVLRVLRDHPDLRFDVLSELTAVDFWPREPRFEVVYLLLSTIHRHRIRVKVRLHGEDAHLPTAIPIWAGANWLEREVWDMFGVVFDGHPDLRRLLMPEDWEGHPLRKDYPVQIRMVPRTGEPLQVTEEEFRANLERDRRVRRES
ncbi:MAG: NADH-quinone oxidoreductase subunit C [Betaproteobacteria bacterium]